MKKRKKKALKTQTNQANGWLMAKYKILFYPAAI